MSVACPSCGREVAIRDPRPGRFRIACPGCARPFKIEVRPDGSARADMTDAPEVEPVPTPESEEHSDEIKQTVRRMAVSIGRGLGLAIRSVVARRSMVGGALILEELGRTSLGTLARGRQVALGRDVLVRILPADWAGPDALSLAQATREEYATRQICHRNLLRRIDFGEDRGRRYAFEEPIEGSTVAQLMARGDWSNVLAPSTILHAARALGAIHRLGIVHGDLGPDTLWVGNDGAVKLDGLGLLGSRAERPVENSVRFEVLARQDVQRLGLTLRTLSTPRNDHERESARPVESLADRMERCGMPEGFRDLADAIRGIETSLGVDGASFGPTPTDRERLRTIADRHRTVPLDRVRNLLGLAFVGVGLAFTLLFAINRNLGLTAATLAMLCLSVTVHAGIRAGFEARPSGLGPRLREWLFGGGRSDRLTVAGVVVLALVVVLVLGWLPGGIVLAIVSTVFAVGFFIAFDAPIARERRPILAEAHDLLASLRRQGVAESAVRDLVRRESGPRWDVLYEALFGIEATAEARSRPGEIPPPVRPGDWRLAALRWLDARLRERRDRRDRERFEPIEERAAIARKVNEMTARRKSRRVAEALIVVGREVRAVAVAPEYTTPLAVPVVPRPIPDLIREAVETPDRLLTSTYSDDRDADRGPNLLLVGLAMLVGPRARFLLGGVLLAAFLLWADQVGVISSSQIKAQAERAIAGGDVKEIAAVDVDLARAQAAEEPLRVPGIPESITRLVSGYGVGIAGLILLASSVFGGWRIALFALPAALIAWFGPRWGVPAMGPLTGPAVASAIGVGLLAIGIVTVGRRAS